MDRKNVSLYRAIDRAREVAPAPEHTPQAPPPEPPSRALDLVKRAREQKPKDPEGGKPVNPAIY